jgi:hypothetical protein
MATKKQPNYRLAPGPGVDLDREVVRDSRGRRISPECVEAAVTDVHTKTGRGRPSLTGTRDPRPASAGLVAAGHRTTR